MKGIVESLPIVASMLAEQTGVRLTISGDTAYTDGVRVNLPLLPASGESVATLAYGYLYHEAAHIRYTDFDVLGEQPTQIGRRILNILEDARIEHKLMCEFPGARFRLEGLSKEIDGTVYSPEDNLAVPPPHLFCNHLLNHMLAAILGRDWVGESWAVSRKAFASVFGDVALNKLEAITAGVHLKTSTDDLVHVVNSLLKALKDAEEEASQKANDQQENTDTQQDDGLQADQGDGEEDQQPTPQQSGDPQDGQDAGEGDQQPSQGQGTDDVEQGSGDGQNIDHQAIANAIAQVLSAGEDELADDRQDAVKEALSQQAGNSGLVRVGMMQCLPVKDSTLDDYIAPQDVLDSTRALRNRIRALLQGEVKTRHSYASQGSRLAGSRLVRLEAGKTDVFRHTASRQGVDTVISLLVDQSGSMGDRTGYGSQMLYEVARESAYAICESVEGVKGVSMAVHAFPYTHENGEDTATIKDFGQPLHKSLKSFNTIEPQGCTPLAEAMMAVGSKLYRRNEQRKILIIATDGAPDDRDATHEAVSQLSKLGIELVAIGINTDAVQTFFRDNLVIRNVQDLPKELFGVLKRLLFSNSH